VIGMSDDECRHGLDAAWCTICKPKPAPVKRAPAPRAQSLRPKSSARPSRPPVPVDVGPDRALGALRPSLFHATAYESWPSIASFGLRTARQLADEAGVQLPSGLRPGPLDVSVAGGIARIRDQRAMDRAKIDDHLDEITLEQWLAIMNERAFLYARQNELTTLVNRYRPEGQDVILFDTPKLIRAMVEQIEVTTVSAASPQQWATCPCRGRETFVPLPLFEEAVADIQEVTVVGGIAEVDGLVRRVIRHHPDGSIDVVVEG
jgi:hypothetical protein